MKVIPTTTNIVATGISNWLRSELRLDDRVLEQKRCDPARSTSINGKPRNIKKEKQRQNIKELLNVYLIPIPKTLIFCIFRHLKRGGILIIFWNFQNFKNAISSFPKPSQVYKSIPKICLTHWLHFYGFAGKWPKWSVEWCVLNYTQCVEMTVFDTFTIRFGQKVVIFDKKVVCFHFCPVFLQKNVKISSFFGPQNWLKF